MYLKPASKYLFQLTIAFLRARIEHLPVGPGRTLHPFLCLPAAVIADQVEAWSWLNVQPYPAKYCDTATLVPKDKLADPIAQFPRRTLMETQKVNCQKQLVYLLKAAFNVYAGRLGASR